MGVLACEYKFPPLPLSLGLSADVSKKKLEGHFLLYYQILSFSRVFIKPVKDKDVHQSLKLVLAENHLSHLCFIKILQKLHILVILFFVFKTILAQTHLSAIHCSAWRCARVLT